MKLTLSEHDNCFCIDLEAETKEEVVKLARFGIGHTVDIKSHDVHFEQSGNCTAYLVFGKNKRSTSTI